MFKFIKRLSLPKAKLGYVPTTQDFITYKDMKDWRI